MMTKQAKSFGVTTVAVVLCTLAGATLAAEEKDEAALCAEAEKLYEEMTGRAPADENVTIVLAYKYTFCPQVLEVPSGTTVRWVNVEKRTSHSVWFKEDGREESERFFPEEIVEQTLDLPPGEHPYLCGPHWERYGMVGTITITE